MDVILDDFAMFGDQTNHLHIWICLELCCINWLVFNPLKCKLEVASRMLLGELSIRMIESLALAK